MSLEPEQARARGRAQVAMFKRQVEEAKRYRDAVIRLQDLEAKPIPESDLGVAIHNTNLAFARFLVALWRPPSCLMG